VWVHRVKILDLLKDVLRNHSASRVGNGKIQGFRLHIPNSLQRAAAFHRKPATNLTFHWLEIDLYPTNVPDDTVQVGGKTVSYFDRFVPIEHPIPTYDFIAVVWTGDKFLDWTVSV